MRSMVLWPDYASATVFQMNSSTGTDTLLMNINRRGGTLSECAAREQKGGTFHFGNMPGLATTILGIDMCPFRQIPPLFLLPPPPLAPTSPPTRQKKRAKIATGGTDNSKHTGAHQLFIDRVPGRQLIDFTLIFILCVHSFAPHLRLVTTVSIFGSAGHASASLNLAALSFRLFPHYPDTTPACTFRPQESLIFGLFACSRHTWLMK
ncbi:hypothetical protein B0H13DRAFT_2272965 [Mycena leptocephala]|nr:hypothetical protein B0H13DRAFT_2272965 [Mycena leptocephala]